MIGFYITSLAVFVAYVAWVLVRYGVPTSISESYYLMPPKWRVPAFYGFTIFTAVPLLIFWLEHSAGTAQYLVFLACASLAFVGAAGGFKERFAARVHFAAAALCAALSQVWIVIYTPLWWVSAGALIAAVILTALCPGIDGDDNKRSAWLFFVELAAFGSVYICLLLWVLAIGV